LTFRKSHKIVAGVAIGILALVLCLVVFLALFDWNSARPAVSRWLTAKSHRPASIAGNLRVHPWSWNPTIEVEGLTLANPTWAQRSTMFTAQDLKITVSLGRLLRGQLVLPEITLTKPEINLERDARGRASWELSDATGSPKQDTDSTKLPTIRRLIIDNGQVHVVDRIRKLTFDGSLSAADGAGNGDSSAFKLHCRGSLNSRPFKLDFNGGPLINISPDKPYDFDADLNAADLNLEAKVSIPKPFDLGAFDAKFTVSGNDLADGFFITGLALPNTAKFRISGTVRRADTAYTVDDLNGRVGSSDLTGKVRVRITGSRPLLTAELNSKALNIVDLAPALGRPAPGATGLAATAPAGSLHKVAHGSNTAPGSNTADSAPSSGLLLPDADLQLNRIRGMDADVTYRAGSITASKLPLKQVSLHLLLNQGVLKMDPLSFEFDQGRFSGSVIIDGAKDSPETTIDMGIDNVNLAEFKSAKAKEAPLQGELRGRVKIHGRGTSIHKLASVADGTISLAIPNGQVNEAIAELTGINVIKGLGLLFNNNQPQTAIRCGVVDFQAQNGLLSGRSIFVDTTNVLITGRGDIHLDTEKMDLSLQGDPKKLRMVRIRSPIALGGTLDHPSIGIKPGKLLAQAGAATALGVLLTPVAAALAFIDPGLAKDKDCAAVLAQQEH
jgi:uncharacterized protein involved in outer membrane biogenesis